MSAVPASVARFLAGKRIAMAGVSRNPRDFSGAILRKLKHAGYDVLPVNPNADVIDGLTCYPTLAAVPGALDGVFAVTAPGAGLDLIRQCADRGVPRIWFHRMFGPGSVPSEATAECARLGIECIAGACPMMFVPPVDPAHRCFRWWLGFTHKLPS